MEFLISGQNDKKIKNLACYVILCHSGIESGQARQAVLAQ